MDELQAGVELALAVFPQSPVLFQSGETALDDPVLRCACKGKVMVSINDHPDIRHVFRWLLDGRLGLKYSTANIHGAPQTSRELVICNWDAGTAGSLF